MKQDYRTENVPDSSKQGEMPKVTVVTVVFNAIKAGRKEQLVQCIESVCAQTYENIEHIIIDGASDDGTLELIKEYEDKGVVKCYSEPDSGIYDAMNKGILKSSGEYILFLNSDDFFNNNFGIEKSVECLFLNNADFSCAGCVYLGPDNKPIGILKPILGGFIVRMPGSHQGMLVKKENILKLNMFDTTYKSAGDYDFVLKLCLNGAKGVVVPLNFVTYRRGGFSDSNPEQSMSEVLKILHKNYSDVLGEDVDNYKKMLFDLTIPKKLYDKIIPKLNNSIRQSLDGIMTYEQKGKDVEFKIKQTPMAKPDGILCPLCRTYRLFGFLPFLKIVAYRKKSYFYLFNSILFWKVKKYTIKTRHYLFGLIPMLEIEKDPLIF